jgi:hypothetical protein
MRALALGQGFSPDFPPGVVSEAKRLEEEGAKILALFLVHRPYHYPKHSEVGKLRLSSISGRTGYVAKVVLVDEVVWGCGTGGARSRRGWLRGSDWFRLCNRRRCGGRFRRKVIGHDNGFV